MEPAMIATKADIVPKQSVGLYNREIHESIMDVGVGDGVGVGVAVPIRRFMDKGLLSMVSLVIFSVPKDAIWYPLAVTLMAYVSGYIFGEVNEPSLPVMTAGYVFP